MSRRKVRASCGGRGAWSPRHIAVGFQRNSTPRVPTTTEQTWTLTKSLSSVPARCVALRGVAYAGL